MVVLVFLVGRSFQADIELMILPQSCLYRRNGRKYSSHFWINSSTLGVESSMFIFYLNVEHRTLNAELQIKEAFSGCSIMSLRCRPGRSDLLKL
jgi:hypothetical protein